ncbi:MAG: hypothetical protein ABJ056_04740 [Halioglobus sp.]
MVKIKKLAKPQIVLEGLKGEFYIEGADIGVHYFSTYATPDSAGSVGGHFELLQHLSPMREKVEPSKIGSLDSLLQRDLSDERIASDLIPYLQGRFSKVGFFPPVLAVLLPKGYLESSSAPEYPADNGGDWGGIWNLDCFQDEDGNSSRLGSLSIDQNEADIIVIDGQHRSNAFRYAADCFAMDDIYKPFYQKVAATEKYVSDLPVTIIWFAPRKKRVSVHPTHISKELFVAVNNSAKTVNESRTVLLDDVHAVSLAVNSYYNYLAEKRGFSDLGKLNLLSAGFDIDADMTEAHQPKFVITNPSLLSKAFLYTFFGKASYDNGQWGKEKANRSDQTNTDRFKFVMRDKGLVELREQTFKVFDKEKKSKFRLAFVENYLPILELLFEKNQMAQTHFQSILGLSKWIAGADSFTGSDTVWNKIFLGGEGLYGAFITSKLEATKTKRKEISAINNKFSDLRQAEFFKISKMRKTEENRQRIEQSYRTFRTIAFQTGFLMAIDNIAKFQKKAKLLDVAEDLEKGIQKITLKQWVCFFNEFKLSYIGGSIDPNAWPMFKKMLIRILEPELGMMASEKVAIENYPEVVIANRRLRDLVDSYWDTHEKTPNDADEKKLIASSIKDAKAIFRELDIPLIDSSKIRKSVTAEMKKLADKLDGE